MHFIFLYLARSLPLVVCSFVSSHSIIACSAVSVVSSGQTKDLSIFHALNALSGTKRRRKTQNTLFNKTYYCSLTLDFENFLGAVLATWNCFAYRILVWLHSSGLVWFRRSTDCDVCWSTKTTSEPTWDAMDWTPNRLFSILSHAFFIMQSQLPFNREQIANGKQMSRDRQNGVF